MTDSLRDLLRDAIAERYGGNMTRLAHAVGVPVQSVSQWVAETSTNTRVPGPATVRRSQRPRPGRRLRARARRSSPCSRRPPSARRIRAGRAISPSRPDPEPLSARVLGGVLDAYERMAQVGERLQGGVSAPSEGGVNASNAALTSGHPRPSAAISRTLNRPCTPA